MPDSLVTKARPMLHVANFSKEPITITPGQVLGTAHNPNNWLDRGDRLNEKDKEILQAQSYLIKTLADQLVNKTANTMEDPPGSEDVGSIPKTAETPEDPVPSDQLLQEVHFSEELTPEQRSALEEVVLKNNLAFGLDGRSGNYNQMKVEVPLIPGAKPVYLPPFGAASPEKREAIDKQMDTWIKLEVIEPSKSPWSAPAFIVYRNKKPRMVIDYRKLHEQAVADEFPLPRQDEILQALEGSQWLSTLDALAGLMQLQVHPDHREKLAFRTHRGLFQFKRMPFGYRNGPAIFQRVMQNVLAPFLWIFALVYIDDIVIFSKSFEEHLKHLDQVFSAIAESGITLLTGKCFLGYRSLLLLGQKVSRLGLSTHKEKVDVTIALDEPKTIIELQLSWE